MPSCTSETALSLPPSRVSGSSRVCSVTQFFSHTCDFHSFAQLPCLITSHQLHAVSRPHMSQSESTCQCGVSPCPEACRVFPSPSPAVSLCVSSRLSASLWPLCVSLCVCSGRAGSDPATLSLSCSRRRPPADTPGAHSSTQIFNLFYHPF